MVMPKEAPKPVFVRWVDVLEGIQETRVEQEWHRFLFSRQTLNAWWPEGRRIINSGSPIKKIDINRTARWVKCTGFQQDSKWKFKMSDRQLRKSTQIKLDLATNASIFHIQTRGTCAQALAQRSHASSPAKSESLNFSYADLLPTDFYTTGNIIIIIIFWCILIN